jgi:iron-sulfur cluster repair protein YtfE (RIC family)
MEKDLKHHDPVLRQAERGEVGDELSPMEPPEAMNPPSAVRVEPSETHPFLRNFFEEHAELEHELQQFEATLRAIPNEGYTRAIDGKLRRFFDYFENHFVPHSKREERSFFPVLRRHLLAVGEHSPGEEATTGVDIMEEEHLKAVQLAAITLNFLLLSFKLPDENSRLLVLDAALEQARQLIELLRLHIFREDNILFGQAHRAIPSAKFERWQKEFGQGHAVTV